MRILIDIGHPAHVHYFKNFIRLMSNRGHVFLIIARDKEVSFKLLNNLNLPFKSRGTGGKTFISKVLYLPKADLKIFKEARLFSPDIFISFASTYAAHVSKIMNKPHIALDDTEHSKFELFLYPPFSDVIINPNCFTKNLGDKQLLLNYYTELLYLHKNYFSPKREVLKHLNLAKDEEFVVVRFVAWDASHDFGEKYLTTQNKIEIVQYLSTKIRTFVSSEGLIPSEIEKFKIDILPEYLHDALYYAKLYIGEGATTASESAILGTPAIYINNLTLGYIEDEKLAGLVFQTTKKDEIIDLINNIIDNPIQTDFRKMSNKLIEYKIDITALLVWLVEKYPKSVQELREDLNLQYRFK